MKRKNQKFETETYDTLYIYIYIYIYTHIYIYTQIESVYIIHTKYRFGWDYICIFN